MIVFPSLDESRKWLSQRRSDGYAGMNRRGVIKLGLLLAVQAFAHTPSYANDPEPKQGEPGYINQFCKIDEVAADGKSVHATCIHVGQNSGESMDQAMDRIQPTEAIVGGDVHPTKVKSHLHDLKAAWRHDMYELSHNPWRWVRLISRYPISTGPVVIGLWIFQPDKTFLEIVLASSLSGGFSTLLSTFADTYKALNRYPWLVLSAQWGSEKAALLGQSYKKTLLGQWSIDAAKSLDPVWLKSQLKAMGEGFGVGVEFMLGPSQYSKVSNLTTKIGEKLTVPNTLAFSQNWLSWYNLELIFSALIGLGAYGLTGSTADLAIPWFAAFQGMVTQGAFENGLFDANYRRLETITQYEAELEKLIHGEFSDDSQVRLALNVVKNLQVRVKETDRTAELIDDSLEELQVIVKKFLKSDKKSRFALKLKAAIELYETAGKPEVRNDLPALIQKFKAFLSADRKTTSTLDAEASLQSIARLSKSNYNRRETIVALETQLESLIAGSTSSDPSLKDALKLVKNLQFFVKKAETNNQLISEDLEDLRFAINQFLDDSKGSESAKKVDAAIKLVEKKNLSASTEASAEDLESLNRRIIDLIALENLENPEIKNLHHELRQLSSYTTFRFEVGLLIGSFIANLNNVLTQVFGTNTAMKYYVRGMVGAYFLSGWAMIGDEYMRDPKAPERNAKYLNAKRGMAKPFVDYVGRPFTKYVGTPFANSLYNPAVKMIKQKFRAFAASTTCIINTIVPRDNKNKGNNAT